ncbi:hypothetical protein HG536_0D02140 [Torulaspora globosa]|uniref:Transcription regulatory protein SNF11 n=1 Tax=Torulaspora globosa TaxID=48254 RepID=A0A7G3ZGQ6_9SACH|nr:uncharacterized protein HG536_0D02140 [Torulaspora globosa]QLL32692.1 hypothetical protein HG536_0D02140 [Torulaspora globosa]
MDTSTVEGNSGAHPNEIDRQPIPRAEDEQLQYKIQLLLHINSILLARVIQMANSAGSDGNGNAGIPEQLQPLASQYLKRVHTNLQCISQINQGAKNVKPLILDPPQLLVQQPAQDILAKLYLLMTRVFEIW